MQDKNERAVHQPKPYLKKQVNPKTETESWKIGDLCKAYQWPKGLSGRGRIALIELGGGWLPSDIHAYSLMTGEPTPVIVDRSIDGTRNHPGQSDADGEVALDIQVAASSFYAATGTQANIVVYWTKDIASGIRAAAKDGCSVCSISWGADESEWSHAAAFDLDAAAADAIKSGMIVLAASGDNDSSDGGPLPADVDLPAASPHVVGCGGTMKPKNGAEVVWNQEPGSANGNGTGGGYSTVFPIPAWQEGQAPNGPGRMVPDVAACADPRTGYQIFYGGKREIVGGTSAVAPLYAGLLAAIPWASADILPVLWKNAIAARDFSDITQGDNGMYMASVGPDPCTGLGAPIGDRIAGVLSSVVTSNPNSVAQFVAHRPLPSVSLSDAEEWAKSMLPSGFASKSTIERAIARGLQRGWQKYQNKAKI